MTIMEAAPIIKKTVTSRQVVEHYGFTPDRAGYICCPFHGEKTGSLKVHKSGWYCYGCHEGGDAVEFIRLYERCRFNQAVAKADLYFNLGLVKAEKTTLDDIYARRKAEQEKRKAEDALKASKAAFSAALEQDWAECWDVYRSAWSTPASRRTAIQWWNMAVAEDMLEYIDYYGDLNRNATTAGEVSTLSAKYEKGVNRDAGGHVISPVQEAGIQANHRNFPDPAGGPLRRDGTAEPADQHAGAVGR